MSRYGIELYASLEAETGLATGWKQCGSLNVARTPERLKLLKRQMARAQSFGVETFFDRRALLPEMFGDQLQALFEQLREFDVGERELTAARELGHVERELREVLDAALDEVYGVDGFLVLRHVAEHRDAEAYAPQWVLDLVRHGRRRAPDRGQRLLTPQVLLGLGRLRHVHER